MRSPPCLAFTFTLTPSTSLTNMTLLGFTVVAVKSPGWLSETSTRLPPGSMLMSTTSGAPNSGSVTADEAATTGSGATAGSGDRRIGWHRVVRRGVGAEGKDAHDRQPDGALPQLAV